MPIPILIPTCLCMHWMPPYNSEDITKGRNLFVIPSGLCDRNVPIWMQAMSKERHQTVEAKKQRGRARSSKIGPLSLGLNPQVSSTLLECTFQAPSLHAHP